MPFQPGAHDRAPSHLDVADERAARIAEVLLKAQALKATLEHTGFGHQISLVNYLVARIDSLRNQETVAQPNFTEGSSAKSASAENDNAYYSMNSETLKELVDGYVADLSSAKYIHQAKSLQAIYEMYVYLSQSGQVAQAVTI